VQDTKKGAKMWLKMIKSACIWFVITLFACVLCVVILSYAHGEEVPNFGTWEEVFVFEDEHEIVFVLKNPVPSDVTFAIITLNRHCISNYILVSQTLQLYQFNGDEYVLWELDEEARKTIWTFLRINCGILSI